MKEFALGKHNTREVLFEKQSLNTRSTRFFICDGSNYARQQWGDTISWIRMPYNDKIMGSEIYLSQNGVIKKYSEIEETFQNLKKN